MRSERWQNCTEIFNAAVEQPHGARAALLEQSCHGDEALRRKVELLLKYHEQSNDLIDSPAFVVAPELLIDDPDARVGQQLGSYRIDGVLGVGGMGVVYLACDERLGRKVGLKLLPQSLLAEETRWERLKNEARTASALNHPNIMTIHEFGEVDSTHYIVTEFIEGVTLRERIVKGAVPPAEAVDIARQVASALCVAHGAGIVHCDIKPENIMVRPDGYVKVLDFGIARFAQLERLAAKTSAGARVTTHRGTILGTARYMSPEQAKGEKVDERSDLWSLGVVLYEMLAGRPPFNGETPADLVAAVLLKEPEPLEQCAAMIPLALQSIVERALRKDPATRYQTAEEMLSALRAIKNKSDALAPAFAADRIRASRPPTRSARWMGGAVVAALLVWVAFSYGWRNRPADRASAPARNEKSIAVLPFQNLSGDSEDAFLAGGLHDDLLSSLAKIKDLKVIAPGSVTDYPDVATAGRLREIGQELGVAHLMQGSVRRAANRVVVNVALIEARSQEQKWAQRYERTFEDILLLQGELAVQISRELHATLTPVEATVAAAKPTQNPEAYLLYLRARETEITIGFSNELQPAIQLYQQALNLDPTFALARARLSLCASRLFYGGGPPEWKAKARSEAEEALRLQPQLGEARLALTHCFLWGDNDNDRARAELAHAAELLPNSAEVPLTAAFIYKRQNRFRDRIAALHRAEALDPRNHRVLGYLTTTYRWVRDWPEAVQTSARLEVLAPRDSVYDWWWWARVNDQFRLSGDIEALKKAIPPEKVGHAPVDSSWLELARYETAILERDHTEAARILAPIPARTFSEGALDVVGHSKAFHEALLAVAANADAAIKQQTLEVAKGEIETRLVAEDGTPEAQAYADLALVYAFLGRKDEALRAALRAVEVTPVGMIEKNDISSALAMVYAQTGEPQKAINLIEHLLTLPTEVQRGVVYNMTLTDLKWRWQWDPLRSHSRFQKLLAGPEPKTVF